MSLQAKAVIATGAPGADGVNAYVYIAYASVADGTGFTTVFDDALDYIAIKKTSSPIASPSVGDFAGLWRKYAWRNTASISRTETASLTLALSDASVYLRLNHATVPIEVTVPANEDVAFPIDSEIMLFAVGVAATSVVAAGGVTINSDGDMLTLSQKKGALLKKVGLDEWDLIGGLE